MSQHQQQQVARVPKQEVAVAGGTARRFPAQNRNSSTAKGSSGNGGGGGNGKSTSPTVTIEEIPNHAYLESLNNQTATNGKFDEEKLPVFLIKLWNIVEDANLQSIVNWDESGASFHISDPYSFCRNVLPHFFKHNNLNSLIRQLNMYGFRKMTPLNQGGLTRTESDQDHLEFSHPCFIQNRPELLGQIKRKQSNKITEEKQVTEQTQQNLEAVMAEMRSMREKAKNMENKMNNLTKENRNIWDQMANMRAQHSRQQAYFKKLLHFLVSAMHPGLGKRVAKRLAIGTDFHDSPGASSSKRPRTGDEGPNHTDMVDLLEFLQRETQEPSFRRFSTQDNGGPLISEVTDEFGNSPGGRNDVFSDAFPGIPRYSDHPESRDTSPHPHISHPSSSANLARDERKYMEDNDLLDEPDHHPTAPANMYMGSGALTHENVHRAPPPPPAAAQKRNYQGVPAGQGVGAGAGGGVGGGAGAGGVRQNQVQQHQQQHPQQQPSRVPYKMTKPIQPFQTQPIQPTQPAPSAFPGSFSSIPPQMGYQNATGTQQIPSQNPPRLAICDEDAVRLDTISPTFGMSPTFDRQLSQEMQSYLMGYDQELDNFRGMMHSQNWEDQNWDTFGDNLPDDDEEEPQQNQKTQRQLALEGAPAFGGGRSGFEDDDGRDLLDPLLNDSNNLNTEGFEVPDPNYVPLRDEELFPHSPVLRTPSPSDLI